MGSATLVQAVNASDRAQTSSLHLIVYEPVKADIEAFVKFWSDRYAGYDDNFYEENVGQELTEERILQWFEWKNGRPLSLLKRASVLTNFVARRGELATIPVGEAPMRTLERFSAGGAIWRIFWLHLWEPERFPIYDQHVHRAMRFILAGVIEEIPEKDADKIRAYVEQYLPFHAQFNGLPERTVDKALWAVGKFIRENAFPLNPVGPAEAGLHHPAPENAH
jgi:hypothetical protein